ncbi:MAG TPA: PBP1A family penicillin-binding protein [Geminicoccaceae bacterium]|nr:PBP1A family penicillin-binding protein [Geminicoccaceae bacterium]
MDRLPEGEHGEVAGSHRDSLGKAGYARRAAGLAGLLMLGGVIAGLLVVVAELYRLPLPERLEEAGGTALDLAASDGEVFAVRGASRGRTVELSEMPRHLIDAVVAMEDRRFFEHRGFDLGGIARAAWANLAAGDTLQGGSTITQQLAKNLFLSPERSWSRKIQEVMLALWLERRLTKDEILARYLNAVYFGAGASGVDAASRRYFGKPVEELTLAESAMLAGLIQAPSRFAPTRSLEDARRRAGIVLDAMADSGVISAATAREAKAHPAGLAPPPVELPAFGYAADFAAAQARGLLGEVSGDFIVATTIDRRLQSLAERTIAEWLARKGDALAAHQAALVALAPHGAILAMTGGRDYAHSQFNRAVQARRQPGSLFKLFVYLAALADGISPDSLVDDASLEIGDWRPRNYAERYLGVTDVRTAFAQSLNSATIRLQKQVGREKVIALAREMGIDTPLPPHPSLALGSAEASLLELTAAYAAVLANLGRVEPYVVRAVQAPGGATFRRQPAVVPEPTWPRRPIMELLHEAVRSGTGRAAGLEVPVFGKTGTTQDHRDAWFIGFVENLVVGVWVGNDDNRPMKGVTGGDLPAEIWRSFVAEALQRPDPAHVVADGSDARPSARAGALLAGIPSVLDTATLRFADGIVQLEGVVGLGGSYVRDLAAYVRDREIVCRFTTDDHARCQVDDRDLSEVVLLSGRGLAAPAAAPELVAAQRAARDEGRGVWATPIIVRGN